MHTEEIEIFTNALQLLNDEFYFDAIEKFRELTSRYDGSELVDDALFNIGLTYFSLNDFNSAIHFFERVINECPDATISILDGGNEFGRTAAKAMYGLVNCHIAKGDVGQAKNYVARLEDYPDSFMMAEGAKKTYHDLAMKALETIHLIKESN